MEQSEVTISAEALNTFSIADALRKHNESILGKRKADEETPLGEKVIQKMKKDIKTVKFANYCDADDSPPYVIQRDQAMKLAANVRGFTTKHVPTYIKQLKEAYWVTPGGTALTAVVKNLLWLQSIVEVAGSYDFADEESVNAVTNSKMHSLIKEYIRTDGNSLKPENVHDADLGFFIAQCRKDIYNSFLE